MSKHDPFEATIHKSNEWLSTIMRRLHWDDRYRAWAALRAVLHVLRDRLTVDEAASLGAQLPLLIRGAYYEGWSPNGKPERIKHDAEFVRRVSAQMRGYHEVIDDMEEVTRVVLDTLTDHVSVGEADHLARVLPKEIGQLLVAY